MKKLILLNKEFHLYITHEQIKAEIDKLAKRITYDLSDKLPLFISLLNGAFMFTSDLLKRLDFDCNISFVKISSYEGSQSTGKLNYYFGLNEKIKGRNVVVIDDIVDTGTTLFYFLEELKALHPSELKVAVMFSKPDAIYPIHVDYLGMNIEKKFVIGYGLDYNGIGRNYKDLYKSTN